MGGGRRYDKQGSAYAIRINREAIDRGRGQKERRGEGKEGHQEGGGRHEERGGSVRVHL